MSTKRAVFWITILCLVVIGIWFGRGLMFGGGEEGIPLFNLSNYIKTAAHTWNEGQAGYDMVLLLPRVPYFSVLAQLSILGINAVLLQAATFFLLIWSGCLAVFFLTKEFGLTRRVSFIASVFYLLNPYSMVQIWGRGIYAQFFAFALVPGFLALYVFGLRTKKIVFFVLAILVSLIFSPAFVFPTQILVIWLPVALYLVVYCLSKKQNIREIIFAVSSTGAMGLAWLGMHSWWLLPYFKSIGSSVTKLGDIDYNLGSLKGISSESGFWVVSRLVHKFMFNGSYGEGYSKGVLQLIGWFIPISVILSLTETVKNKLLVFFWVLLFVGLFVVMGTNSPLGFVFEWIFRNFSPFQGFRNPYEKAGMILLLGMSPLVAVGIHKLRRVWLWLAMVVLCGWYVWPMWTGQFAGGVKFNPWFEVPNYYREADMWMKSQDSESKIIQLPLNPGDGVVYKWEHSFQGLESGELLFTNPSIGRNIAQNKIYYNVLLQRFGVFQANAFGPDPDISRSELKADSLSGELERLNVRFIVLHHDVDPKVSNTKTAEETAEYLKNDKHIRKVNSFGLLDIYEVTASGGLAHIYSPNTQVSYKKISPTLYEIQMDNVKEPYTLHFLERFDQGWKLVIDNKEIDNHSLVYSYANSWKVEKLGSYKGVIKYQPQDSVVQGTIVSIITFIILIVVALLLLI